MATTLPPKLYFRIGEVASLVGVEPHVLRYWEREFRTIRPTKSAKGQRVYSRRDVENLMRVRDLLYADGFTIAGAKKKLQRGEPESLAPESAPAQEPALRVAEAPRQNAVPEAARQGEVVASNRQGSFKSNESHVRTALLDLRSEIEALLTELGG